VKTLRKHLLSVALTAALLCTWLLPASGAFAAAADGNSGIIAIAAGNGHYISLKKDGTVWAWGDNSYGQLGTGTRQRANTPVQVPGLKDVVAVDASGHASMAVKKDGTVWFWGIHTITQTNQINEVPAPRQLEGIPPSTAVSITEREIFLLHRDGTVSILSYVFEFTQPDRITFDIGRVQGLDQVQAVSGNNFLRTDGTVWRASWESGRGYYAVRREGLDNVVSVDSSDTHTLAVKKDGTVWAYGSNWAGQLGDGSTTASDVPVQVQGLRDIAAAAAGYAYSLALGKDGVVWGWGNNQNGAAGVEADRYRPEILSPVNTGIAEVRAIAAGRANAFGIKQDGSVIAWGREWAEPSSIMDAVPYAIPAQFEKAAPMTEGWALVSETGSETGYFIMDRNGANRAAKSYADYYFDRNSRGYSGSVSGYAPEILIHCILYDECGFRDRSGQRQSYGYVLVHEFVDGIAVFYNDGKYGAVDRTATFVIPPEYDFLDDFSEGMAYYRQGDETGFIDLSGRKVFQFREKVNVQPFSEGLALVSAFQRDAAYFVDKSGNIALTLPRKYRLYRSFWEGLAVVAVADEKTAMYRYGAIDKQGNEIVKPQYSEMTDFSNGYAVVTDLNGKKGIIDRRGVEVIKPRYEDMRNFSEGYAAVKLNGKWGYVDMSGRMAIEPQFDSARSFEAGAAWVEKDGRWGLIDRSGRMLIKPQFIRIGDRTSEGTMLVYKQTGWGYVLNPLDVPADWAKPEVDQAAALGLVPLSMQYHYGLPITRAEFSKLAVKFIETKLGKPAQEIARERNIAIPASGVFSDTMDPDILTAYAFGIVGGIGDGKFNPDGKITRQEAASLLARTAGFAGIAPAPGAAGAGASFSDEDKIAGWAKSAVSLVTALKDRSNGSYVMGGVGGGAFGPQGTYTREQAFITMKRLFYAD